MPTPKELRDLSLRLQVHAAAMRLSAEEARERGAALREYAEEARRKAAATRTQATEAVQRVFQTPQCF